MKGGVVMHRFSELATSIRFTAQGMGEIADTCNITMYNLAEKTIDSLASKDLTIKVFAGYESERNSGGKLPILVAGQIMNVYGRREVPNHITEILCVPTLIEHMYKAKVTYKTGNKETFETTVNNIIAKAVKENPKIFHDGDLLPVPMFDMLDNKHLKWTTSNYTFTGGTLGHILTELCEMQGIHAAMVGRTLNLYAKIVSQSGTDLQWDKFINQQANNYAVELKTNLVRGIPEAAIAYVKIPYKFSPTLRCGAIIDTANISKLEKYKNNQAGQLQTGGIMVKNLSDNDFRIPDLNKFMHYRRYQVFRLIHNIETHGNNWTTIIEAVAFNDRSSVEVVYK